MALTNTSIQKALEINKAVDEYFATTDETIDNIHRSYHGISLDVEQCTAHLRGAVRDNLLDREERQGMLDTLRALHEETGFNVSEELLADIQAWKTKA